MMSFAPWSLRASKSGRDGITFADVGADDEDDVGAGDFFPLYGAAIHMEGEFVRHARRNHAQAAVVIDVPRAQTSRAANLPIR